MSKRTDRFIQKVCEALIKEDVSHILNPIKSMLDILSDCIYSCEKLDKDLKNIAADPDEEQALKQAALALKQKLAVVHKSVSDSWIALDKVAKSSEIKQLEN